MLDRIILWSGILLVVAIAVFGTYYYFDQKGQNSGPSRDELIQTQVTQYEQVVRDDPNNITNRLGLADLYLVLDRFQDAATQYEARSRSTTRASRPVGLGRPRLSGDRPAHRLQAVIDKSQEEDVSGELVQSAHYYFGVIAMQLGDLEGAITQLTEATRLERSDSDAWQLLGTAYFHSGKLDEAADALAQAVLFVPDFTEAYDMMAQVYDQQGARAEALYARGMLAYSNGKYDDAAKKLEEAVGVSPTLAEAYSGLGLVRERQNLKDEAIRAYEQALHLKTDDFNARSGLARLTQEDSGTTSEGGLPANHPATSGDTSAEQEVTP
jgi:tetratricopeptide (TPR) repeat protein